jgi:hypothetical protein
LSPSSSFRKYYGTIFLCYHEVCHGKTELDGWFGRMMMILDVVTLTEQINTADELVSCLQNHTSSSSDSALQYEFVLCVFIYLFCLFSICLYYLTIYTYSVLITYPYNIYLHI